MNIRELDLKELNNKDLNALADKIRDYYGNSSTMIEIDIETVKNNWTGFIQAGLACIFVIEEDGMIVGIISGLCYPDPLSGKKIAQEVFWYVDSFYRHRGFGAVLINTFTEWAKLMKAKAVRLAHLVDLRAKENQSLYEGLGYKMAEVTYEKEI